MKNMFAIIWTFAATCTISASALGSITYHSHTNAHNGDGSNSLTIARPAGIVEHDFLLAQISVEKGSDVNITPPAGWTLVRRDNRLSDIGQAVYRKTATASEPVSYTWSFTNAPKAAGGITRYSGVENASPIIATSGNTGDSNTLAAPGLTAEDNALLIATFCFKKKETTLSVPAGMTGRYNFENPNDVTIRLADEQVNAGPTGSRVSTPSPSNSDKWVAQLIALRAAAAAPTNEPPTCAFFAGGGPFTLNVGVPFSISVIGDDPDGDNLVVTVAGAPAGAVVTPPSGSTGASPLEVVFDWTPSSADVGSHSVSITFTDPDGESSTCSFDLNVVNLAPTCSIPGGSGEPYMLNVGSAFSTTVVGDDVDGDFLTVTITGLPAGAIASPLSGLAPLSVDIDWVPAITQVGSHNIQVNFADPHGANVSCSFEVFVTNLLPESEGDAVIKVNIGEALSHVFTGTDPDPGDVLTVSNPSGVPAGAVLHNNGSSGPSPMTATFEWTPAVDQVGQHIIIVRFTDLSGEYSESTLIVCVHNRAPTCSVDVATSGDLFIGELFAFQVTAEDDDPGDVLTLLSSSLPAGASTVVSSSTGGDGTPTLIVDVSWTPTIFDVGSHDFEFTFSDFNGAAHTCSLARTVVNRPPICEVGSHVPAELFIGELFAVEIHVSDPDAGDQLSVLIASLPAGATYNLSGEGTASMTALVSWTPTIGDVGSHDFEFTFSDYNGATHSCSFALAVVNRGPQCTTEVDEYLSPYNVDLAGYVVTAGFGFEATFSAADLDAGDALTLASAALPAGAVMSHAVGDSAPAATGLDVTVQWTPAATQSGFHTIELVFHDSFGEPTSCAVELWVNLPPVAICPGDVTVAATSIAGAEVSLDGSGSFDPDGSGAEVTFSWLAAGVDFDDPASPAPTGVFPLGTTMVTLTITDEHGGVATCDMFVTVVESTQLEVFVTTNIGMLWPANHKMVSVQVIVTTTSDCVGPQCALPLIVYASSSEPDNASGNGDGNTTGDVNGHDGHTAPVNITHLFSYNAVLDAWVANIQLRAERAGGGNGRCYGIEVLALDNGTNISLASCCVVVPHNMGK